MGRALSPYGTPASTKSSRGTVRKARSSSGSVRPRDSIWVRTICSRASSWLGGVRGVGERRHQRLGRIGLNADGRVISDAAVLAGELPGRWT